VLYQNYKFLQIKQIVNVGIVLFFYLAVKNVGVF